MVIIEERELKKGRRVYGHYCTLDDGQVIYLARRKHSQIFRAGQSSISCAMTEGLASWAIDEHTLFTLRVKKIAIVGIRVIDTGDLYLGKLIDFFDLKKASVKDYSAQGGARQRYLPLVHFIKSDGEIDFTPFALTA